jgi:ABC-2 type transport system permease protein
MNTPLIISSFKKEIWEFNKTLFWVPLIIAIMIIVAPIIKLMLLESYQTDRIFDGLQQLQYIDHPEHLGKAILGLITGLFAPFILVALLIQLYYFTTCLFDERRDLSIYFWRSLPVSDALTVAVKLITGALVIPAIFMLGATLAVVIYILIALLACMVLSVGYDISLWQLWGSTDLISNLASMWFNILPYALWMFPLYAWLMLASMFAKKAPFLWAVLPVIVILLIEAFVVQYFHLHNGFFGDMLINYFTFATDMLPHEFAHSESPKQILASVLFAKIDLGGTILGCALIYLTYWLRANRSQA